MEKTKQERWIAVGFMRKGLSFLNSFVQNACEVAPISKIIERKNVKAIPVHLRYVSLPFSHFRTTKSGVLLLSSKCRTKVVIFWQLTVKWKWKNGSQL